VSDNLLAQARANSPQYTTRQLAITPASIRAERSEHYHGLYAKVVKGGRLVWPRHFTKLMAGGTPGG
jgi:hypothetical protein